MNTDTPLTDKHSFPTGSSPVDREFAKKLERDLTATKALLVEEQAQNVRLREALNKIDKWVFIGPLLSEQGRQLLAIAEIAKTALATPTDHSALDELLKADRQELVDLREKVALAYGHLWHVNNEPMAPIPLRSKETAAHEARKILRDTMTHEQRGAAINKVAAAIRHMGGEG